MTENKGEARTTASANYVPKVPTHIECSIEKTLDAIGGKWSFLVLRELFGGPKRFGELQRRIKAISPTALTNTLRHLEEQGVLERRVYPTVPITVHKPKKRHATLQGGIFCGDAVRPGGNFYA